MTALPRLFSVPGTGEDTAAVSLLKDAGAVELQPEVVTAEPVDQPAGPGAGWRAERTAWLAGAPRIVPVWLRRPAEFADAAGFAGRYYGHVWAFYGLRTPVYAGRLWVRAPRGGARLAGRWWRWVADAEAKPAVAKAAASDAETWMKMATVQTNRTNGRRHTSLVVGVPVAVLVYLAFFLLPGWVAAIAGVGVATLLGFAGRDADRPIVHRYVSVRLQRRLDSGEVEMALEAIGVKGKVDFVAPIQTDGPGWRAEVDLPPGVLAETVLEKRAALAAAMRRPLATVWPELDPDAHPGRLVLWVARQDPAKAPRRLWPLLKDGQTDLFEPIPFGFDPRGRLVTVPLMYTNMLIGGVMGSGKTSAVLTLALNGALDLTCEEWIYEMKGSGDLEAVKPICHRYVSGDDDEHCEAALDGLRALEREMKRRKKIVAELPIADVPNGRKVYKHLARRRELGLHPILAIFDEAHTLYEHEQYGEEAAKVSGRLIRKARAYGIILIITTQRPDGNSIPKAVSDNAILRFCLAVTGHLANNMVLGSGAYARGVRATMFDPRKDAGTGWLARSPLSAEIARAAFITQQEAVEVGQRALALRIAAGTLTGQAAGEAVPEIDDSTLIDHLRAVWPAGEETMHSATLVEALAAFMPEAYGAWMDVDTAGRSTMLAAALKPYGIGTRQVQKRGAGGSAKGLRWEDVKAAERVSEDELEPV